MKSRRLFARLALGGAVLLIGLAGAGLLWEQVTRSRSAQAFPPPGRLVDLGTHALHLHCLGDGSPTVLLEAGLSRKGSLSWSRVHAELARETRTCAYDRAGIMWSESGPRPRDAERIAADLDTLLAAAGEAGPYVLVGHSMGGIYARQFAATQGDAVVGMVLVDASHPEQVARLPEEIASIAMPRLVQLLLGAADRVGLTRLLATRPDPALPDSVQPVFARFALQSQRGADAESEAFTASLAQGKAAGRLGDMPLVVLTKGTQLDSAALPEWSGITAEVLARETAAWLEMQQELAALSTAGRQQTVPDAGHDIQLERPDVVVEAVREVVREVRRAARDRG